MAVKEEQPLAGNLLSCIEYMAGDYDSWQDYRLPDMSADFGSGYDLPDMAEYTHFDFDYEPMQDMPDDPMMDDSLPDMDMGGFEEYDIEAEFKRIEAGFKAVEYQWLLRKYQAFPAPQLQAELESLARSIHPYPLDPNHPVYR